MPTGFHINEQDLIKIGLAILCGGILGLERQYKNKIAGFRTMILICLGSTIFTMAVGPGVNINIVTGVGFIGAGVIFKDNVGVSGLTTAAVIWISAAIGMAIGSNDYYLALIATILILVVLVIFNLLERYIDKVHRDKLYEISFVNHDYDNISKLNHIIKNTDLRHRTIKVTKKEGNLITAILVTGHQKNIYKLDEKLMAMSEIKSF